MLINEAIGGVNFSFSCLFILSLGAVFAAVLGPSCQQQGRQ